MAALVTTMGIDSMSTPYATKAREPTSEIARRRTTEVIANDTTTNAEAR